MHLRAFDKTRIPGIPLFMVTHRFTGLRRSQSCQFVYGLQKRSLETYKEKDWV